MNGEESSKQTPRLPPLTGAFGRLLRGPNRDIGVEVMWQAGAELQLRIIAGEITPSLPAVEELVLECSSTRQMTRLGGAVSPAPEGRLHFEVHDLIEVEQRRRFVRVRVSRPVRVARDADGSVAHTFALDLSGGGLLLAGPDRLTPGEHVSFHLRLEPDTEPIQGYARVVRVQGTGHPAVAFDSIKPADRERLIHFIFDSERRARALLRSSPPSGGESPHERGGDKGARRRRRPRTSPPRRSSPS